MATRRDVHKRRTALIQALRDGCRSGRWTPGEPAPSIRQLAEEYSVSTSVVNSIFQTLIAEGLFHTLPRVGTFVGQPNTTHRNFYLLLQGQDRGLGDEGDLGQIQTGFEERIAELGGATLAMPLAQALQARASNQLPPLAGVFDLAFYHGCRQSWGCDRSTPRVGFSGRIEDPEWSDEISYDNEGGGCLATRHLLGMGHKRVAFLALHGQDKAAEEIIWSRERETGWRRSLEVSGYSSDDLAFYPLNSQRESSAQVKAASELGELIIRRPDITAVVAANDFAAMGLIEALSASGRNPGRWPAIVGFDNRPLPGGHVLTSLRLPAEEVGRAAAELLWERRKGQLTRPPEHRRIAMRLIPRLTSLFDGSLLTGTASLIGSASVLTPLEVQPV